MTDIEKLKELEAKATRGPWSTHLVDDTTIISPAREVATTCDSAQTEREDGYNVEYEQMEADASLIVAMRNALPALLASLASKDAEIERQAQALREMTFSRDTWRKVATGRGSDIERETKIARAAEARLAAALAALGEARVYLAAIVRFLNVPLAKLNALEGNEDD